MSEVVKFPQNGYCDFLVVIATIELVGFFFCVPSYISGVHHFLVRFLLM